MKTVNSNVGTRGSSSFKMPVHLELPTLFLTEQEDKMNQEEKLGTIYIATNLINGKQYVGQTVGRLNERKNSHYCTGNYFHNALKKYSIENFKWDSFPCPEEDLDKQETFLIKELNTLAPNGYNLDSGGNKNKHHHEITKQKMKKPRPTMQGENHPNFGNHRFVGENHPNWGKHPSEETIQKISGKNHPRARAVILISPEGIKYNLLCFTPFCKEHSLSDGNISLVLQGKRKHHKGWTGRYLEENK